MARRPLDPSAVKPTTAAIFNLLLDAEWHGEEEIITVAASACRDHETDFARKTGSTERARGLSSKRISDAELIRSGANAIARNRLMITVRSKRVEKRTEGTVKQYRMTDAAIDQWTHAVATATPTAAPAAKQQVITIDPPSAPVRTKHRERTTNIPRAYDTGTGPAFPDGAEATGWAEAPLAPYEMVHFKSEYPFDQNDLAAALPNYARIEVDDTDGLYRIWGRAYEADGDALAEAIVTFFTDRDLRAKGLKVERERRRRDLNNLPPNFCADLYSVYFPLAMKRVQKSMTTIKLYIPDYGDIQQHVAEWVLKAIATYDATKGVPFGAFLTQRLHQWVYDLPRARAGRGVADTEIALQRTISAFEQEHHRTPTEQEIADLTGQSVTTLRRNINNIATLNGMRNAAALEASADEGYQVQVADETDVAEDIEALMRQSMVAACFTEACTADETAERGTATEANPLGWIAWYMQNWGGKSKTELSQMLGTSMRNLTVYQDRAEVRMRENLMTALNS